MQSRSSKQMAIAIIFLSFSFLFLAAFYFLVKDEPTCSDQIQNQGELGVDCGGPCASCPDPVIVEDLQVLNTELVYDTENQYDVAIKVKNPNDLYGAKSFGYKVKLVGSGSQVIGQTALEKSFILPGETKYVLVPGIAANSQPSRVDVELSDPQWMKFTSYEPPNLVINNNQHETLGGGVAGFFRTSGTLINQSPYDFEKITVKVLVRDPDKKLLAASFQTMHRVLAGELRDYNVLFSHHFPGTIQDVEVQPEVNVFDSENYVRAKGAPQSYDPRSEEE